MYYNAIRLCRQKVLTDTTAEWGQNAVAPGRELRYNVHVNKIVLRTEKNPISCKGSMEAWKS